MSRLDCLRSKSVMRTTVTSSPVSAPDASVSKAATASRARRLLGPRYVVCLAILVFSAAGMQLLAAVAGVHFRKDPVPLKNPLDTLDWSALAPRYQQHLVQPEPLDEEVVHQLGTEQYLQARLIDTEQDRGSTERLAHVFITYYTGQPDLVPHVPDECYLAGGYDQVGAPETISAYVPDVGAPDDHIPVRVLQFKSRDRDVLVTVMYFFHANGQYRATRDGLRWLFTTDPFERYAYYAKIEVTFTNDTSQQRTIRQAGKEEAVQSLEPLLRDLMPVLLKDHLAWDRVKSDKWKVEAENWVRVNE